MTAIKNILNVNIKLSIIILFSIAGILTTGCKKEDNVVVTPISDSNKKITSFVFLLSENPIAINILGTINEDNKTITAIMPPDTDITALLPAIEVPSTAQVSPDTPQDFTNPVEYTISAEDGSKVVYTATVTVALNQRQILQTILDANPQNLMNWDLQNTADLGTLLGVTTNIEGLITELSLTSMDISQLPSEIGQLTSLTELSLSSNQLTTIPSEIGQLTSLTKLSLSSNQLTTIPSEIGQLINLTSLGLGYNYLTTIPSEIGQLVNLTKLYIHDTPVSTIPVEIGQLTNLTLLSLFNNQISNIPSTIGQLVNLTELYLNINQLTSIPSQMGKLTNLLVLHLENNQLTSVPSEMGKLTNLQELHLENNQLTSVAPEIGFLTNLNYLAIHENQLTVVPQAICNLKEYYNPNMLFAKDVDTPCEITSPKDALIGIYSSNPNNALGWHFGNFPGAFFDGNQSLTKLEIQNKGIQRIPACGSLFEFCELLDVRNNPFIVISSEVCALRFTSTVGFSILTDPGEGCD